MLRDYNNVNKKQTKFLHDTYVLVIFTKLIKNYSYGFKSVSFMTIMILSVRSQTY